MRQAEDELVPPSVWEREFRYVMAYWLERIPEVARDPAICERACKRADEWARDYSQLEDSVLAMQKLDQFERQVKPSTFVKSILMAVVAVLVSIVMVITMIPH